MEFRESNLPNSGSQLGQFEGMEWSEARPRLMRFNGGLGSATGRRDSSRRHFDPAAWDEFGRRYAAGVTAIVVTGD